MSRMTEISASLVKELRDRTGAGMMDRQARARGDRRRRRGARSGSCASRAWPPQARGPAARRPRAWCSPGLAASSARSSPSAARPSPSRRTRSSSSFAEAALDAVEADGPDALAGLEERRLELSPRSARTSSSSAARASRPATASCWPSYVHPPANKIGVLVRVKGSDEHRRPQARDAHLVRRAALPQRRRGARRTSSRTSARSTRTRPTSSRKPEEVRAKIVEGRPRKEFLVRGRAQRAVVDPRSLADGRQGARGGRARGARVRRATRWPSDRDRLRRARRPRGTGRCFSGCC